MPWQGTALKLVEGFSPFCSSFGISGNLPPTSSTPPHPRNQLLVVSVGFARGRWLCPVPGKGSCEMDARLVPKMSMHRDLKKGGEGAGGRRDLFIYLVIGGWSCPKSLTFWEVTEVGGWGGLSLRGRDRRDGPAAGLGERGMGFGRGPGPARRAPAVLVHCTSLALNGACGMCKVLATARHKRPSSREIPLSLNQTGTVSIRFCFIPFFFFFPFIGGV